MTAGAAARRLAEHAALALACADGAVELLNLDTGST